MIECVDAADATDAADAVDVDTQVQNSLASIKPKVILTHPPLDRTQRYTRFIDKYQVFNKYVLLRRKDGNKTNSMIQKFLC